MDLTFKFDDKCFNYRVGAIIIHNGNVLFAKNEHSPYYYSVGGRVHFGETLEEAVVREVKEETGVALRIDRLGFLLESFFTEELSKKVYHEIGCFYYMNYDGTKDLTSYKHSCEIAKEENLEWVQIAELPNLYAYPLFLKTELQQISSKVKHIIERQDGEVSIISKEIS